MTGGNGGGNPDPGPTQEEIVRAVSILWRAVPQGSTVRFVCPIQPSLVTPGQGAPTVLLVVTSPTRSMDYSAAMPRRLAYPEPIVTEEVA